MGALSEHASVVPARPWPATGGGIWHMRQL